MILQSMEPEKKDTLKVLMLRFEKVTILDFIAPYDTFRYVPNWEVHVVGTSTGMIRAEGGLGLEIPESLFDHSDTDILFVPGGAGINVLLQMPEALQKLRELGSQARYVTSVCTGSLLLGAAGLLKGYRATSHWRSLPLLAELGAHPTDERIVVDRNRITAGGITSGMDFALELVRELEGPEEASRLELWLQYQPSPPMGTGHPTLAPETLLGRVMQDAQEGLDIRRDIIAQLNPS
ncbi:MAG: DJ-1/PfpI family protein [Leptospiraceae bacterium]|nr:DJ-1/PfpI family protein [Leptospiraceae bacterium]